MNGFTAVYLKAGDPLVTRQYPLLPPSVGVARLRLVNSGICGTDLHILHGRLAFAGPMILGHEFIGRVDALGSVPALDGMGRPLNEGDAAIACVAIPCGNCMSCRREEQASCMNFGVTYVQDPDIAPHFFGGYGDYLFSPLNNLLAIPAGISLDAVSAFPCAGPTIIRACSYGGELEPGELVVVQGTGALGLFAIAWAVAAGCVVLAIGSSSAHRTKLAKDFGARMVLDYRSIPVTERAKIIKALANELGRGDGADVVIEASGVPTAIPEGIDLLRTRGRYLIPGQYSASGEIAINPELITFRALRLIGSGQYTLADVATYLDFLAGNSELQAKFAATITHRFSIEQANAAMEMADSGEAGRIVFTSKERLTCHDGIS